MPGKRNNMKFKIINSLAVCFFLFVGAVHVDNDPVKEAYMVETIQMPDGLTSETGGITFLADGRLVACFIRGEVMIYNPQSKEWKLFAEGLHEPLGIIAVSNSEFIIMQRPELTRVKDTDGDGQADVYEKITDDFGLSGNYHEFNYGPVKDKEGNLFISLNTASPGGNVKPEIRGKFNPLGRDNQPGLYEMYSVVPNRGWVMKITPAGKLQPYASGMRSPNGLGFDREGNLFVTDNQSDWVETSTLYHVKEGKFYGHPASLVWSKDWKRGNPFVIPINELDSMRTKAAVLFPQGIMANSPSQPLCDITEGKFGPFAGQLFIGEMNRDRIVRVMLEEVGGQLQGACIPFIDGHGLRKGNNRLAFAPDGSLWVGQIAFGWSGDQGIQRIVYNGKQPTDVYSMNLTANGFDLTFTQPVDKVTAMDPDNYNFRHYYYKYQRKPKNEGADKSTQQDIQNVPVKHIKISSDRKKISLSLGELKAGYIYELKLGDITNTEGKPIANKLICYTLNKLLPVTGSNVR
jgi:glucose/arabinose dehydrogenase